MRLAFAALILFCAPLFAQFDRPVRYFSYDPPGGVGGGCKTSDNLWNNWTNGNLFKCIGPSSSGGAPGTWMLITSGAAGGFPTDIRAYGAICNGTNQNTAVQAAISAGSKRIFIPAGCLWIPPGGIIPGGAAGLTFIGENATTSIIASNAAPSGTLLQAGPGVVVQQMNLQGSACSNIPNCQNQFYANMRNVNDIILTTGQSALNFAAGQGSTDFSGSNFRNYGVGEAIFTDTFGIGPGLRAHNDNGSTGAAILCGNFGGAGPCQQFITNSGGTVAHIVGYSDGGSAETSRLDSRGALTLSGYIGTRNVPISVANGANENIAISGAGFVRLAGPTGAFSIGGIVNTGAVDGRHLTLFNGTAQIMTIANQDSGSTAANRIFVPGGADYVCPTTFCIVELIYDGGTSQWVLQLGGSGGGGSAGAALTSLGTITTTPAINGGSGTVLTITAVLGANITCGTISGFTAGQYLTLKLTQDGTGGRTFTCAGMADLGTVSGIAGKTDVQVFYAPTSSTLQAMGSMWCFDCDPAIIIPGLTSGSLSLKVADIASGTLKLPAGSTDLSATGGTSQVVKQVSVGAPLTVGPLACADLSGTCGLTNATIMYVSATGNDSNPGTSWTTAKLTVAAAVNALPLSSGGVPSRTGTVNIGPGTFTETATPIEFNADLNIVCSASGDNNEGVTNASVIKLGNTRNTALFSYTSAYSMANGYAHFIQMQNCMLDGNKANNTTAPALVKIWNGGYQNTFTRVGFQNAHDVGLRIDDQAVNFSCYTCTFAGNDGGAFFLNDLVGANVVLFQDTQIDNSGITPIQITQATGDTGGSNIATFINTKFEATTGVVNHVSVINFTPRSSGGNPFNIHIIGLTAINTIGSGTYAIHQDNQGGYGANWEISGVNVGGYTAAFQDSKTSRVSANGEIKHLISGDACAASPPAQYSPDLELSGGPSILTGTGTPEAHCTANVGSTFHRIDGSSGTSLYVKETGSGNTGWTAVSSAGGGSPVGAVVYPFGPIDDTFATITNAFGTGNATYFREWYLPSPGITLANLTAFMNASAPGHVNFAIYDGTCTLLTNGAATTLNASANVVNNFVFSPTLSLPGGKYYIAWTSDSTTMQMFAPRDSAVTEIGNANESSSTYRMFLGTASTGTSTLVFPGTCGTRTQVGGGATVSPGIALH